MKLIECVPNFSEGRRREVIESIVGAITAVPGVLVLDVHSDPAHNRTVVTFVGSPEPVLEGAFQGSKEAVQRIDLEQHRGSHPRIGAVDVVPFVPLIGSSMEECVILARRLGERLGRELGLPVYLYGEAARRPDRRKLSAIRRGQYEGLKSAILTDPEREPDFGPRTIGPAGATAVGARDVLVAYNINLASADLSMAREIARSIRESSGGLRGVQALGMPTLDPEIVQVSVNLVGRDAPPLHVVFERVKQEAAARGGRVLDSEVVGLLPTEALVQAARHLLQAHDLTTDQTIEARLLRSLVDGQDGSVD